MISYHTCYRTASFGGKYKYIFKFGLKGFGEDLSRSRESIGVRWPRGWTRGSLMKLAGCNEVQVRPSKGQKFVLFACTLRDIFEDRRWCSCRLATLDSAAEEEEGTKKSIYTLSLLNSFLSTVSAPFPLYERLYSLAPLGDESSGGRHLNWTLAITGVSLLRGSERGRESEKASSFRVPFCFGAASFKSYRRRGNPKLVEIACKRSPAPTLNSYEF